jgi:penicillin-binding protein 1A
LSGSEEEPAVELPEQAAEQMRDATDRLREQGWMVAPMTTPVLPAPQPATQPATQPSATQPAATQPPATQPPVTEDADS